MSEDDDLVGKSGDELIAMYRSAADRHGACSAEGNHAEANEHAEVVASAYGELRRRGTAAQRQILQLLADENESVRSWAGAHALEVDPRRAEAVLSRLSEGKSLPAFSARMTLREWRAGGLTFD